MNRPYLSLRSRARRAAGLLAAAAVLAASVPNRAWACACGCYAFDVQTSGMLPTQPGGVAFLEYDFMNQKQNWGGLSKASDGDNSDKQIRTNFQTVGVQYMFNRSWGFNADLPVWNRYFKTTDASNPNQIDGFTHTSLGDAMVRGIYTGFSSNMSSGLTFGLRVPTGDWRYPNFDRDSEIGTGSTDLLLGAFHQGALTADNSWSWFLNGQWDEPTLIQAGYRPGAEVDAETGVYYNDLSVGAVKIAPMASLIGAQRWRDSGPAADSPDSGYRRLLLAPGFEITKGVWHLYGDVGFPVAQYANGDQLVASEYYKFNVSWSF